MTNAPVSEFPILQTERLLLRHLEMGDSDFIFEHFRNPLVTQYLLDEPPLTQYAQAQAIIEFYLESHGKPYNRWLIVRKADNQPIGTCGYHKWSKTSSRAEIGYDLSPSYWGQGYMREALHKVMQHGFELMKLNRIDALVYVNNKRSLQLLQKLGFQQEGLLRDYFCLDGIFYDHYLFALLQREWER